MPVQACRAALRDALDDLNGGDDQVDAEVMGGLREWFVEDLELMDGGGDHRGRADESGFFKQGDLDV